jgi:hypothetical protein
MSFISQMPINSNCSLLFITFTLSGIAIPGLYVDRWGIGVAQQKMMLQRDLRMHVFKFFYGLANIYFRHIYDYWFSFNLHSFIFGQ